MSDNEMKLVKGGAGYVDGALGYCTCYRCSDGFESFCYTGEYQGITQCIDRMADNCRGGWTQWSCSCPW